MSCETDSVGYVSRKINHKIYRSIRAYEAGFKSIRPTGHCQFVKEKEALQKEYVAYTYWQWKVFYENIFARLIDGRLELSYLWDVSEYEEWCRKHDIEKM